MYEYSVSRYRIFLAAVIVFMVSGVALIIDGVYKGMLGLLYFADRTVPNYTPHNTGMLYVKLVVIGAVLLFLTLSFTALYRLFAAKAMSVDYDNWEWRVRRDFVKQLRGLSSVLLVLWCTVVLCPMFIVLVFLFTALIIAQIPSMAVYVWNTVMFNYLFLVALAVSLFIIVVYALKDIYSKD